MCPLCMTNAALVVAGVASGAGVIGLVTVKVRALRRHRRGAIQSYRRWQEQRSARREK